MARPRAADHDEKRAAILQEGARLFAERGYDRTSMSEIAAALGVSKALFYHYYASKDALLFDIVRTHLLELVAVAEAAAEGPVDPRARLHAIVTAILDCYRDADAEHKIQINHLSRLAEPEQAELKALERRLVDVMADAVAALNPSLPARLVKPLAMSVFGVLNWKYMWFRENGPVSRVEYARLVTDLFADGVAAVATARAAAELSDAVEVDREPGRRRPRLAG